MALNNGAAVADAQYKSARALVFLREPDGATRSYVEDRGYRVVLMGQREQWDELFSQYPDVFGAGEEHKIAGSDFEQPQASL